MTTKLRTGLENLLVFWTSGDQAREALRLHQESYEEYSLPGYFVSELRSRIGRNGRGRLWVPEVFDVDISVDIDQAEPLLKAEITDGAGIVFHKDDVDWVRKLPGVVTDHKMREYARSQHVYVVERSRLTGKLQVRAVKYHRENANERNSLVTDDLVCNRYWFNSDELHLLNFTAEQAVMAFMLRSTMHTQSLRNQLEAAIETEKQADALYREWR